jgi:hypothetical protein
MNETRPISAQLAQLFMTVHHPSDGSHRVPISYSIASLPRQTLSRNSTLQPPPAVPHRDPASSPPRASTLRPHRQPPMRPRRRPRTTRTQRHRLHAVTGLHGAGIAPPPGFAVWVVRPQERREGVARASALGW